VVHTAYGVTSLERHLPHSPGGRPYGPLGRAGITDSVSDIIAGMDSDGKEYSIDKRVSHTIISLSDSDC